MSTGYVFFKGRYVHFVGLQHMRCGTSDMESTSFILFSDQTPKMCLQPTPTEGWPVYVAACQDRLQCNYHDHY